MYHRNSGENINKEKVVDNKDGQVNKSKRYTTGQLWNIVRENDGKLRKTRILKILENETFL